MASAMCFITSPNNLLQNHCILRSLTTAMSSFLRPSKPPSSALSTTSRPRLKSPCRLTYDPAKCLLTLCTSSTDTQILLQPTPQNHRPRTLQRRAGLRPHQQMHRRPLLRRHRRHHPTHHGQSPRRALQDGGPKDNHGKLDIREVYKHGGRAYNPNIRNYLQREFGPDVRLCMLMRWAWMGAKGRLRLSFRHKLFLFEVPSLDAMAF